MAMETTDEIKRVVAKLVDTVAILKREQQLTQQLVEIQRNRIAELENALHELNPKYYNRPAT